MSGHDGRVWLRLRTQRSGLRTDTLATDLIERHAHRPSRTDVSKAVVCPGARPSLRVPLSAGGRTRRHMPKPTGSPQRFASICFPPASPAVALEAGKQKTTPKDRSDSLICLKKIGAGEGIRTLDPDLGKVRNLPALGPPCLAARECGPDGMGGENRTHTPDRRGH
jgi:hypothetical protein